MPRCWAGLAAWKPPGATSKWYAGSSAPSAAEIDARAAGGRPARPSREAPVALADAEDAPSRARRYWPSPAAHSSDSSAASESWRH